MITCLSDQLRRDEDNRQYAYDDESGKTLLKGMTLVGNLTAGIGRNLSAKGLSQKERDFLLANDIADATVALESNFPWTMDLDDVRKGALLNITFNEGIAHLAGFHIAMGKLQSKDYTGAAAAFLDSLWAREVGARAQRLVIQIQSGFWQ
jgi:lysozyme